MEWDDKNGERTRSTTLLWARQQARNDYQYCWVTHSRVDAKWKGRNNVESRQQELASSACRNRMACTVWRTASCSLGARMYR